MTRFTKENLIKEGKYLFYQPAGGTYGDRKCGARFRTAGVGSFATCLRKNFTVEEYFDLLENECLAPLKILETKGYVSPTVARILKERGYPVTLEARDKMIKDDIARRAE